MKMQHRMTVNSSVNKSSNNFVRLSTHIHPAVAQREARRLQEMNRARVRKHRQKERQIIATTVPDLNKMRDDIEELRRELNNLIEEIEMIRNYVYQK